MKGVRIRAPGGLSHLENADLPDPGAPGAGEIRVRIHASSLNYHDYRVVSGDAGQFAGRIPMSDGAGVVEAVGPDVTGFCTGDKVVSLFCPQWRDGPPQVRDFGQTPGDGIDGYAREIVVCPASFFTRAPVGFTHAESATLTTAGLTAWRALTVNGALKAGDTVLVLGTGGVSIFALQFARTMGARVIATSSSEAKMERLRTLGAAHVINYRQQADWGKAVLDWTDGRGVDHVLEVGGAHTLHHSVAAVRTGGLISLIGALSGRSGDFPTASLILKQARLQGHIVGSHADQLALVAALEATGIRPVIDSSHGLDDLAHAFRHQEAGLHFGKIVLEF